MHGRTIRIFADAKVDLKDVERMIIDGEIDQYDLLTDARYKYVYHLHKKHLDELLETHDLIERLKTPEALEKLKKNRKKK